MYEPLLLMETDQGGLAPPEEVTDAEERVLLVETSLALRSGVGQRPDEPAATAWDDLMRAADRSNRSTIKRMLAAATPAPWHLYEAIRLFVERDGEGARTVLAAEQVWIVERGSVLVLARARVAKHSADVSENERNWLRYRPNSLLDPDSLFTRGCGARLPNARRG